MTAGELRALLKPVGDAVEIAIDLEDVIRFDVEKPRRVSTAGVAVRDGRMVYMLTAGDALSSS